MNKINNDNCCPLYMQIYDDIKEGINKGIYKSGSKLPSEADLIKSYNVSRITVRKAISKLEEEKLIVKKHGKGSFVAIPIFIENTNPEIMGSFTANVLSNNKTPKTEIISKEIKQISNDINNKLGVSNDENIIKITRLRYVDDQPVILEFDYFNKSFDFMLNIQPSDTMMGYIKQNKGIIAKRFDDTFDIFRATKAEASKLKCSVGTPLLQVFQIVLDNNNQIIYYNEQLVLTEFYKYAISSVK